MTQNIFMFLGEEGHFFLLILGQKLTSTQSPMVANCYDGQM